MTTSTSIAQGGSWGEPQTILLVEDDPDDVLLIKRAFLKAGRPTRLDVAGDGEAAVAYLLNLLQTNDADAGGPKAGDHALPRVVLLDLKLPRKSGLEVLAWLHQHPGLRALPVVVLTSSRESRDLRQAYELGVNSYLTKPAQFDALVEMMRLVDHYWVTLNEQPTSSNT